jgi:multicomponent Na+:H+ antiporter subunit B
MPTNGDRALLPTSHVAPRYLEKSFEEVGGSDVVTAVLASYRGYETSGDDSDFRRGICLILLLRRKYEGVRGVSAYRCRPRGLRYERTLSV